MAHYAKVLDGIVVDIMKIEDESFWDTFVDQEGPGDWIKTSFSMLNGVYYVTDPETGNQVPAEDQAAAIGDDPARLRHNYAQIGGTYDKENDVFLLKRPIPSWVLNDNYEWVAPLPQPEELPPLPDGQERLEIFGEWVWEEDLYQADTGNPKTEGWVWYDRVKDDTEGFDAGDQPPSNFGEGE